MLFARYQPEATTGCLAEPHIAFGRRLHALCDTKTS
jgi:hypothetical protein